MREVALFFLACAAAAIGAKAGLDLYDEIKRRREFPRPTVVPSAEPMPPGA
jgi:hypothetical protein